jgi:putative endonuclease
MKQFTSPRQKIGLQGELFAQQYIVKHGYKIMECNFSCKLGEVDIIATKDNVIHFFEVKAIKVREVSYSSNNERLQFEKEYRSVMNPFQNITNRKKQKLIRTVEYYFHKNTQQKNIRFQIDGIGIIFYINNNIITKTECLVIPNIII